MVVQEPLVMVVKEALSMFVYLGRHSYGCLGSFRCSCF